MKPYSMSKSFCHHFSAGISTEARELPSLTLRVSMAFCVGQPIIDHRCRFFNMRFFIAGIMQGSHTANHMHDQDYRERIAELLEEHFPGAEIYDPLAKHKTSLEYDKLTGREVFFCHNAMCREVDVLLAFIPEASMGTAIEMWEAHQHGAAILTISPMKHNWTVKFLSHALYADEAEFIAALRGGSSRQD